MLVEIAIMSLEDVCNYVEQMSGDQKMCRVIKIYSPSKPEIGAYYSFICMTPEECLSAHKKAYKQACRSPDKYYKTISHPIIKVGDAVIEVVKEPAQPGDDEEFIYSSDAIQGDGSVSNPRNNLICQHVVCECGALLAVNSLKAHLKSDVHFQTLEDIAITTPEERAAVEEQHREANESLQRYYLALQNNDPVMPVVIEPRCICGEELRNVGIFRAHYRTKKHKQWAADRRSTLTQSSEHQLENPMLAE